MLWCRLIARLWKHRTKGSNPAQVASEDLAFFGASHRKAWIGSEPRLDLRQPSLAFVRADRTFVLHQLFKVAAATYFQSNDID